MFQNSNELFFLIQSISLYITTLLVQWGSQFGKNFEQSKQKLVGVGNSMTASSSEQAFSCNLARLLSNDSSWQRNIPTKGSNTKTLCHVAIKCTNNRLMFSVMVVYCYQDKGLCCAGDWRRTKRGWVQGSPGFTCTDTHYKHPPSCLAAASRRPRITGVSHNTLAPLCGPDGGTTLR